MSTGWKCPTDSVGKVTFAGEETDEEREGNENSPRQSFDEGAEHRESIFEPDFQFTSEDISKVDDSSFGVVFDLLLTVEYFNNMKKCWEPMIDKTFIKVFHEKVRISIIFLISRYSSV